MKQLILDTDLDTDCDDAGAFAVLHHLANCGDAEISGVICSIPKQTCADCATAINAAYDREEIPVGLIRIPDWRMAPRYRAYVDYIDSLAAKGKRFYNEALGADVVPPAGGYPDAARLYRQLLVSAPDRSVTICAIGTLTALHQLLISDADQVSPLTGVELVAAKVERLVTMALGTFPEGADGFNWKMDGVGAAYVLEHWPTPVTVSELGGDVLTGRGLIAAAPADHPVRRAYEIWFSQYGPGAAGRPSWDPLAVLYAVNGVGTLFVEHDEPGLQFDAGTGRHRWHDDHRVASRSWLAAQVSSEELAEVVEAAMIASLEARR